MYLVVAAALDIRFAGYASSKEEAEKVLDPLGNPINMEAALSEAWAGRDRERPFTYFVGGGLTRAMFSIVPVTSEETSKLPRWVLVVYEAEVGLFARLVGSVEEVSRGLKDAWVVSLLSGTSRTRVAPDAMWEARTSLWVYQALPYSLATLVRVREVRTSRLEPPDSWELLLVAKEALRLRQQTLEALRARYATELATLGDAKRFLNGRELLAYLSGGSQRVFGVTYQLEKPVLDEGDEETYRTLYDLFEEAYV